MGKSKEITKEGMSSRINFKVLGIIFALTIAYQISLYQVDPEEFNVPEALYLAGILGCAVFSFMVFKKYRGSEVFSKAYLFLALAFVSWFIGDVGYVYYDHVLQLDPYPNPFDVGFAASYLFASLHLLLNIRYFRPQWNIGMKILLVALPIAMLVTYSLIASAVWGDYDELSFDIIYGNLFAVGATIELSLAILGAIVFRRSILKEVWLLLVIGIFIWTIGDVWYAFAEVFETFDNTHPTNTLWVLSFMVVMYALYKHRKVI
ncbi:hypothetical protein MnTg01_00833 [archaeon MnTg01]|nr:hypothetical protein MnTg01_00833 [archaeon MnTg01]